MTTIREEICVTCGDSDYDYVQCVKCHNFICSECYEKSMKSDVCYRCWYNEIIEESDKEK